MKKLFIFFGIIIAAFAYAQFEPRPIYTITGDTTIPDSTISGGTLNPIFLVSSSANITLPHAAAGLKGREAWFYVHSGLTFTLTAQDTDQINESASFSVLLTAKNGFILFSDGVKNWYIAAKK